MIYPIFDSLLEPVFVLNSPGQIIYCNETAATLCGSTPRKLVRSKSNLSQAIQFDEPFAYLSQLSLITAATPYKELKFHTESYENGKAQITIQPYSPQPGTLEFLVFFRDVTLEERLQKKYRAELEQKETYISELQSARNQLEIYSKDLESLVQQRTAEIQNLNVLMKALLDSLNQAFFVFDHDGLCAPLYSKACLDMLGGAPSGQAIWDVLRIPNQKVAGFKNWLFTVYGEMLPFEDLKPLGPDRLPHESKSISLDYVPIRNADGKIEKIVCIGSDITDLVAAQKQADVDRSKVEAILKMIQNKKELRMFLLETNTQLKTLNTEFIQLKNDPNSTRDTILRVLHTIKGGAATFSYTRLKETAHSLEEKMLPTEFAATDMQTIESLKQTIEYESKNIFAFYENVFGELKPQDDESLSFTPMEVQHLLKSSTIEQVQQFLEEKLYFQPVKNLTSQFPIVIEKTAQLLGKSIHPMVIKNDSIQVPVKTFDAFFGSFIHVLRNSIDHGIETASVRREKGKPELGMLSMDFSILTDNGRKFLRINYRDDGHGINPERIRAKLTERNIPHSQVSDDEVIYFIFNPSFSTRDTVTETSGRGIGLDAVKHEVDRLGGKIKINTELGKYTEFIFELPYPQTHLASLPAAA